MHRLRVTPPKTTLGAGNLCPQLPAHSAPFYPFFKVSPDASKSDLVPTLSHSNLLSSILHSHRFSHLLLKTDQLLCRIPKPCRDHSQTCSYQRTSFLCSLCTSKGSLGAGATAQLIPPANTFSAPSAEDVLRPVWFFQQQLPLNNDPKASFPLGTQGQSDLGRGRGCLL